MNKIWQIEIERLNLKKKTKLTKGQKKILKIKKIKTKVEIPKTNRTNLYF